MFIDVDSMKCLVCNLWSENVYTLTFVLKKFNPVKLCVKFKYMYTEQHKELEYSRKIQILLDVG